MLQESKTDVTIPEIRDEVDASVVDIFCGAGGLSHGLFLEGFDIAAGIDLDPACEYPFEENNASKFLKKDICAVSGDDVLSLMPDDKVKVLVGCAPCQPFSKYSQGREDPRWNLLHEFGRLISEVSPDIVSMENVPQLTKYKSGEVFADFVLQLENQGYFVSWQIAFCPDFGVPQSRSRLVLLASKWAKPSLLEPLYDEDNYITVQDAIGDQPILSNGETNQDDKLHTVSALNDINLKRIKQSKQGGTWKDWDDHLVAACHKEESGLGYRSVYGRMSWDKPSPTITTQFFGFGNGRFGHPVQDRAISLREGAILQSFPPNYKFIKPENRTYKTVIGRLIGNAVPVALGRAIGVAIKKHIKDYAP